MEWVVGGAAAIITAIAGLLGGLAANRSSKTSAHAQAMDILTGYVNTVSGDNGSLRGRVDELEKNLGKARDETARCELDKERMKFHFEQELGELKRTVAVLQQGIGNV